VASVFVEQIEEHREALRETGETVPE
jgi:hypothetical protein